MCFHHNNKLESKYEFINYVHKGQVKIKINQLRAVSRTQQGRQREPSVRHSVPPLLPNSGGIAY